jgi:glucokinase
MSTSYALGVDVGGTKILAGVVDCASGAILAQVKAATPARGKKAVLGAIERVVADVLARAPEGVAGEVGCIGLGVAGQVDPAAGVVRAAPNLGGGLTELELGRPLEERFALPVRLGNDVEVAAIGESRFGAGRGVPLFACVFVGTGVGGALVQDGVRFRGASSSAGEIGHIVVERGGRLCGCGRRGHLEAYASRTAIVARLREAVDAGEPSMLRERLRDPARQVKSKPLARAVQAKDPLAVRVITEAAEYLGLGMASLINLWNPQRIVLGGGVIARVELLLEVASRHARELALEVPAGAVDIVRAGLGDNSGIVGAALLAVAESRVRA